MGAPRLDEHGEGVPALGDVTPEYNPYEAGIGFAVDLDTDFLGKDALLEARETGIEEEIAPITLDESGTVVDAGHPVLINDEVVAYTCRADYDYSINAGIACACLSTEYTDVGQSVEIEYGGGRYDATVRFSPLFDP